MKELKTIKDIDDINISDCYFFKNEYNEKIVTLSFHHKNFRHSVFRTSKNGDYIVVGNKRYYYPYNNHRLIV